MSGFVVGWGEPEPRAIETMFGKIRHRGPHAFGILETPGLVMAQNYLHADGIGTGGGEAIPAGIPQNPKLKICYDGQMGNWTELAQSEGIPDGPLMEERLLLHVYQQSKMQMFKHLDDAVFAFVISDGEGLLAARDLLGVKTLFYGRKSDSLYFASELKAVMEVTEEVYEFPPGHYMDHRGWLTRFAELPKTPPSLTEANIESVTEEIRRIIEHSFGSRVDFRYRVGNLLSGGIDSSVIAFLADRAHKERFGDHTRLKTFALGVGESNDIQSARVMAETLGSDHHELIVDLDEVLDALPDVIYHLESFDPSLVRSSVSNYLISRHARRQGIEVLLSGEGGDEIFCGYSYLKDYPQKELFQRQMECLGFLHNNASLRLDRMNQCHSVRVVAPLISGKLLAYAMSIPPEFKQRPTEERKIEKWIFRKAYESVLPESIVWRPKEEFSQGSGSADLLPRYLEEAGRNHELEEAQTEYPMIRSKEELYYFRIFKRHFGSDEAVKTVGQWICL